MQQYFASFSDFNLENIYSEVFRLEEPEVQNMQKDIARKYKTSQQTFQDMPPEEQKELQMFSFLCMLSFDVYVKKQLIESLIDMKEEKKLSEKHSKGKKSKNDT